jgi:hypothetical protein
VYVIRADRQKYILVYVCVCVSVCVCIYMCVCMCGQVRACTEGYMKRNASHQTKRASCGVASGPGGSRKMLASKPSVSAAGHADALWLRRRKEEKS